LSVEVEAVIDTGFTDYLMIPVDTVTLLGLSQVDFVELVLADGSVARLAAYEVTVEWNDEERLIPTYAVEGNALIGVELLLGSLMTIEFINGGTVTIEPGM
jgi:clan AA aspartic protease